MSWRDEIQHWNIREWAQAGGGNCEDCGHSMSDHRETGGCTAMDVVGSSVPGAIGSFRRPCECVLGRRGEMPSTFAQLLEAMNNPDPSGTGRR